MDFYEVLDDVLELLRSRGRVTYRALKVQFQLDDEQLETLKEEILYAQQVARDEDNRVLVWTGDADTTPALSQPEAVTPQTTEPERAPASYTPTYLAEKIRFFPTLGDGHLPLLISGSNCDKFHTDTGSYRPSIRVYEIGMKCPATNKGPSISHRAIPTRGSVSSLAQGVVAAAPHRRGHTLDASGASSG